MSERQLIENLLHQLLATLPFVEDMEPDDCYKPAVIQERIVQIRNTAKQAQDYLNG
jgi:hypothetical protein